MTLDSNIASPLVANATHAFFFMHDVPCGGRAYFSLSRNEMNEIVM